MKLRYKKTGEEREISRFNPHAASEVLTGDDSAYLSDFDVWLEKKGEWKDLGDALRDHDVIVDNFQTRFFEPETDADRKRGHTLDGMTPYEIELFKATTGEGDEG